MSGYKEEIRKKIDAYVNGGLSEQEIEELWNAFAKDPDLLKELELEVGVKRIIEEEAKAKNSKSNTSKVNSLPSWTWHAAAAAVLIIVAGIQLFQIGNKTELTDFLITQAPLSEFETTDAVRSEQDDYSEADSLLNEGLKAEMSGNSEKALSALNELIDRFDEEPYGSKAFTNKGILYYNKSEYDSAVVAFENALQRAEMDNKMIREKALWYKSNALVNTGNLDAALEDAQSVYALEGIYRKPAFLLLQKLSIDLGYIDYDAEGES